MSTATQDLGHLIRFIPAFRELDEADLTALGKACLLYTSPSPRDS